MLIVAISASAAVTYSGDDPATKKYGTGANEKTFLDIANTTTNATIKSGNIGVFAIDMNNLVRTWQPDWLTITSGSTSNSQYSYSNITDYGYLATVSNSSYDAYTQSYGYAQVSTSKKLEFFVTGITGVALLQKDNNSNKKTVITVEEYNGDGTYGTAYTTSNTTGNTNIHILTYDGSTLSASKYYRVTLEGDNSSSCTIYQIRFTPAVNTFKVTYKAGAGTGDDVVDNAATAVDDCPNTFTAPSEGQGFVGWNTESDGTGTAYAVGAKVSSDLTLFAQWATVYSVIYNLGDATGGTAPTQASLQDGETFTVAAAPTDLVAPAGKEFKCWNDGSADYNASATYTIDGANVTLTAVYQDKTYQGLTPTETLDFANLGSTFSTMWYDNSGKMDNNFYFDAVNGKVVISAYAIYQSNASDRNLNLWATTDSGNSSTGTWTATGDFKGSTYYFNDDARAANIRASARIHYYRVTGITSVSALFDGKAAIEAYEVNSGVVFPDYAKQNKITAAGTATITELDADKEYVILVRGDNGDSGIRFYEIEFTFPAVTTETVTIPSEGFATYVTSSALDFSSQNGAFKAYVASSVNDAKTSVATTEVTKVPAGTALLLKGAAGSYDVEIAESADAVTNLLKASNGGVKGDNSTVFAYSKSAGKFKKVAQDVVIPAGKAYLKLAAAAANTESLDIDFDTATAVEAIAEANAEATAPVKVIKNGKLFIGNYNVAGQQVK